VLSDFERALAGEEICAAISELNDNYTKYSALLNFKFGFTPYIVVV